MSHVTYINMSCHTYEWVGWHYLCVLSNLHTRTLAHSHTLTLSHSHTLTPTHSHALALPSLTLSRSFVFGSGGEESVVGIELVWVRGGGVSLSLCHMNESRTLHVNEPRTHCAIRYSFLIIQESQKEFSHLSDKLSSYETRGGGLGSRPKKMYG